MNTPDIDELVFEIKTAVHRANEVQTAFDSIIKGGPGSGPHAGGGAGEKYVSQKVKSPADAARIAGEAAKHSENNPGKQVGQLSRQAEELSTHHEAAAKDALSRAMQAEAKGNTKEALDAVRSARLNQEASDAHHQVELAVNRMNRYSDTTLAQTSGPATAAMQTAAIASQKAASSGS